MMRWRNALCERSDLVTQTNHHRYLDRPSSSPKEDVMKRISTFAACIVFAVVALSANGASAGTKRPTNNAVHHASDHGVPRHGIYISSPTGGSSDRQGKTRL
jgi:hypothetical protein